MNKIKKGMKYIATGFLTLLVLLCIYTFVMTDLLKKDYVNVFGYSYFVVATGSMSGEIEVDDIIFVKLTDKVKINDIITFKNENGDIITHRLIIKNDDEYITKGDVNNTADDPITKDQIIGKVQLVISPAFIIKCIAIFLIIFILLALVNFDNIIKKYIIKDDEDYGKLPDDLFINPKNKYDEPSSGMTVTIELDEMERINKAHEDEVKKSEDIEVLDFDEYLFPEDVPGKKNKDKNDGIKDNIDLIVSILKCKKNNVAKAKMNKKWLTRYQYVYKLCHLLLIKSYDAFATEVFNPSFKEIYDYDLDKVGLTEIIRNKVYSMPIYTILRLLTYCILYNDDEMFDGIYKIMKYKVEIDKDNDYKQLSKNPKEASKEINTLVSFMKKISNKFDKKNVFELDKIERIVKISNY